MREIKETARLALQLMDLTSLNHTDTAASTTQLCQAANTLYGSPAALCVYPEHIIWAKSELQRLGLTGVKVATVTNFPGGYTDIERAMSETARAVAAGADEVDVVFPYAAFLQGDEQLAAELVASCKQACGATARLKVILETGILETPRSIQRASEIAIENQADFIKTSTGKVAVNATVTAAKVMLDVIKANNPQCGFKAAGGVRTAADAEHYLSLAEQKLGADYLAPATFRFGASGLLTNLIAVLAGDESANTKGTSY